MYTANEKVKMRSNSECLNHRQKGSSLIEVMVALFVLAIGLLGVLSMQVKSMQYTQSAFYYSQAMYLANEMLESMRSNSGAVDTYRVDYDTAIAAPTVNCNSAGVVCTSAQLRILDLYQWRENVKNTLSSGKSEIVTTGDYIAIKVQFDDSRSDHKNATSATISEYVLVTEIN